jgi:hypothetical protein|tara:strand:- start:1328 stop:2413 length:1086 start_codon:yes stop_codon:yes gene_type:complete
MPPQNQTIEDVYKKMELDMLYSGKSSGEGGSLIRAMQGQEYLNRMPQSGSIESLTPVGGLDLLAETAITGASQMKDMNPLAVLLAGALAPGAYKNIKTRNTPALLKKFDIKVDSPVYHNTTIDNAAGILEKNRIKSRIDIGEHSKDRGGSSVSITRDPAYSLVPGLGASDLDVQFVLDKKGISKMRGTTISPYAYGRSSGKTAFRKGQPKFEAEERVYNKIGIPTGHIKAIKLRGLPSRINDEAVLSLIKKSTNKKIPIMVEPGSENTIRGLLDILDPKQKSKALKNIKFTKSGGADTKFKKLSGGSREYEAIINGKKYTVYKEMGDFYADDVGFLGNSLDEVTDFIKSGDFDEAVQYSRM